MKWRASRHALDLRAWVNRHYPTRDKKSDGLIGDAAHRNRPSDHNPDPKTGVVRALDIDADLKPKAKDRSAAYRLADMIRHDGQTGMRPVAYVIYGGKIASRKTKWAWAPYDGNNPHHAHIHVSFKETHDE